MSIWQRTPDIEALNQRLENTLAGWIGIQIVEAGPNYLKGMMPVDRRTRQPIGFLHGGASVVLAETLGSIAGWLVLDPTKHLSLGLEINANHVRPAHDGIVYGVARPLHLGRTTHVWQIEVSDPDHRLISVARLTLAIRSGQELPEPHEE